MAPADLATAHLEPIARALQARLRRLDGHLLESATIDALLELAEHPDGYDPGVRPEGAS